MSRRDRYARTLRNIRRLEIALGLREPGIEDTEMGPGAVIRYVPATNHVQIFPGFSCLDHKKESAQ